MRPWLTALLAAGSLALAGGAHGQSASACVPGFEADTCGSVEACTARLADDPYDIKVRIALCDRLLDAGELLDAMVVLRQGRESCGNRGYACSQLDIALSNVEERAERDTPDLRAERRREQEFKRQYCLGPSASDESIRACNEALLSFGDDGALYEALGAKYQRRGEPAEAVRNLQRAVPLLGEPGNASRLLEEARQARGELARACLGARDLDACDAAMLPGAADELALQRRRAELLLGRDRDEAALQALLNAQSLAPDDRDLADDLLRLIDTQPTDTSNDAELNDARAAALATLDRTDDAIVASRRVLELDPGNGAAIGRLAALREARRQHLQTACFATDDIDTCRDSLLPGEPDEQQLRSHIAAIEQARIAAARPPPDPEPLPEPAIAAAPEPPTYDNSAAPDGATH